MLGYNATPPPPWGWGPDPKKFADQFKKSGPVLKLDGPIGQYEASVPYCDEDNSCGYENSRPQRGYGPGCGTSGLWIDESVWVDDELEYAGFWTDLTYRCDPIGQPFCAMYSNETPPGWKEAYGSQMTPLEQSIYLTPCATVGQKWAARTFLGTLKKGIFEESAEVMAAQISADTDSAKRFLLNQVGRVMAQAYGVGAVIIGAMIGYRNALSATKKEAESFLALVKPLPMPPPGFQPTPLP